MPPSRSWRDHGPPLDVYAAGVSCGKPWSAAAVHRGKRWRAGACHREGTTRTPRGEPAAARSDLRSVHARPVVAADDRFPRRSFRRRARGRRTDCRDPVASSRAVSAFMSNLLPELERARPASAPSTPASRQRPGRPRRRRICAELAQRSARDARAFRPIALGCSCRVRLDHTEAVVSREARSTRRSRTLVLTGGALLGGSPLRSLPGSGWLAEGRCAERRSCRRWRREASARLARTRESIGDERRSADARAAGVRKWRRCAGHAAESATSDRADARRPRRLLGAWDWATDADGRRPGSAAAKPAATSYDPDKL